MGFVFNFLTLQNLQSLAYGRSPMHCPVSILIGSIPHLHCAIYDHSFLSKFNFM